MTCKSNSGVYYFINEKTKKLIITIIYIDNICFINSKDFLLLLELKWKFIIKEYCDFEYCDFGETKKFLEIYISYNWRD